MPSSQRLYQGKDVLILHTGTKKLLSLAFSTMILHLSFALSKVSAFPMMNNELFARVKATFIRLTSFKKPMEFR
jgi:hypothetical protein